MPRWQARQLWAALGFSRLALLFGMHDVPLASGGAAPNELISRQVRVNDGCLSQPRDKKDLTMFVM